MKRTRYSSKQLTKLQNKYPQALSSVLGDELELTPKQRIFVHEYLIDWNATTAAIQAGYSERSAHVTACELLKNPKIKAYTRIVQQDIEQQAGVSKLMVVKEHMKIAFSSIAKLHNTWITRKKFEELTEEEKACIAEIQTQTRQELDSEERVFLIDFVKIKLYDKQKALESLSKMLGYDAPTQINIKSEQELKVMYRSQSDLLSDLSNDEFNAIRKIGLGKIGIDAPSTPISSN